MVHLTGQWTKMSGDMKESLDPRVRELCQKKHNKLDADKQKIECNVLKYYPPNITRGIGAPPAKISRMNYSNDIMTWMALGVFRHWFASALALDRHRHAKDGGYWLYSKLAAGGPAYLAKGELKSFHEKFPMSTRGENVLEEHVERFKNDIKAVVKPLMKNESQLDCERYPVDYTTCVKITREEVNDMWADDDDTPEWARTMKPPGGNGLMKPPGINGHGNGSSNKRQRADDD
jgi:hypothetical protein